jgi:hypothetical protein
VNILIGLWGITLAGSAIAVLAALIALDGVMRFVYTAFFVLMIGVSGVMVWGLRTLEPWARMAQIVLAGLGILLTCPFVIASVTIIVYMLRPATKARFAGTPEVEPQEQLFAIALVVGVLLGWIGMAGTLALAR